MYSIYKMGTIIDHRDVQRLFTTFALARLMGLAVPILSNERFGAAVVALPVLLFCGSANKSKKFMNKSIYYSSSFA